MNCPNCGAEMRERDRAGIRIDFCPDCKGVWLDRGELDKIVERESRGDDDWDNDRGGRSERRYEDRDRDYRPKKSKKKSFFESVTEMMGGGED